jgi:lipopolysaccharide biosynthesis regulator YciM
VLKHLISIYQAERDWEKAIDNAARYEEVTGEPMGKLIGQFECELAERHRSAGDADGARRCVARLRSRCHVGACGHSGGRIESAAGNDEAAIRAFERAARHDPEFLPEILPALLRSYARRGPAGARAFLAEMTEHYRGIAPVLALTHCWKSRMVTEAVRTSAPS